MREHVFEFGPFRLEVAERRLLRAGEPVPLRPKVFDTLVVLVENHGHLLGKDELLATLWTDSIVEETNLAHNVSVLRKSLAGDSEGVVYIETVPRRGYRFVATVKDVTATEVPETRESVGFGAPATLATEPAAVAAASIAVLPFVNVSPDPQQEFFCYGMSEEVINTLTQMAGLHVVARTSSFQFRGREVDVREVARALGVATVLEGSVRKAGNQLRITAQLIRATDGYHSWSGSFDRELGEVFEIQEEIAHAIVDQLKTELLGSHRKPRVGRPTENMEVYNLYLEALHHFRAETPSGMERSIALLERAVELEPDFAPGHAHLARCYSTLGGQGFTPVDEALPKAEEAASRALALDETLAEAHLAAGTIRAYQYWDWQGAGKFYERSLELNPGSAEGHHAYTTMFLAPLGRLEEGERAARLALDLDPLSAMRSRILGQLLFWRRKYDEAIAQLRHALELDPDLPLTRQLLAAVLTANEQPDQAAAQRQIALQRAGREAQAEELGRLYREGGEEALARRQIERGLERYAAGRGRAYNLALLYAQLDEKDEAFRWLQEALAARVDFVIYAKVHPWLDNLRSDPRFEAVLDELGVGRIQGRS